MKLNALRVSISIAVLSLCMLISGLSWSCTGIELKTKDGSFINGRTVEFGEDLDLAGLLVPRNYEFKGTLPDGSVGMTYRSKYAVVGAGTFSANVVVDGINEQGLSVGVFYFPEFANYGAVTPENREHTLSPTEFANWLLTQFATVEEVQEGIKSVVIAPSMPKGWGKVPPFHYIVYDKSGKSIVIEPLKGQLSVYDNPLGVITNSPTFDWHLTNLSNYINLSSLGTSAVAVDGIKINQFGQGAGLHGLPGDFTPPSRFIRAAIFSSTARPAGNAQQAVLQAFHILNQFDIPVGSVRSQENGSVIDEYTLATTVKNPENLSYYFRVFDDQTIRRVSLNNFDMNSKDMRLFSMKGSTPIIDVKQ